MEAVNVKQTWGLLHTVVMAGALVGIVAVGVLIPASFGLYSWLGTLALLAISIILAGHGISGRVLGCLIDGRNRMSLARLQTILWTLIVLSAFLTEALIRIRGNVANPLSIAIPEQLLVIIGISVTSLVGSPLILSTKKDKEPREEVKNKTIAELEKQGEGVGSGGVGNVGQVIVKSDPASASLSDLFKGEETSNAAQLDLGRIQMFYFTVVLVLAYGVQLGNLFLGGGTFGSMPELSAGAVALLGISHAGYLANKATPS